MCNVQWSLHYTCKAPKIEVLTLDRKKNDTPPSPFGTPKVKKELTTATNNKEQLHPGLMGKRAGDASPFKGAARINVKISERGESPLSPSKQNGRLSPSRDSSPIVGGINSIKRRNAVYDHSL